MQTYVKARASSNILPVALLKFSIMRSIQNPYMKCGNSNEIMPATKNKDWMDDREERERKKTFSLMKMSVISIKWYTFFAIAKNIYGKNDMEFYKFYYSTYFMLWEQQNELGTLSGNNFSIW